MSDVLVDRIVEWASGCDDVRAALLVGSRARSEHPADAWSDTDVVLLATDPDALRDDPSWLEEIGDPGITFVERTPHGGFERRVLFYDGRDVDFVLVDAADADAVLATEGARTVLAQGFRVLVDKDGLLDGIDEAARLDGASPSAEAFAESVSDFWYHAVWTARKLRRGEVFVAKECLDTYMKDLVVRVAAWQAGGRAPLHGGRFLEQWADRRVLGGLRSAYATYDREDLVRALRATMDLFSWLARETAASLGYAYPTDEEGFARGLTLETLR